MEITKKDIIKHYKIFNKIYFFDKLIIPNFIRLNGKIPYGKFICNKRNEKHIIGISRYTKEWSYDFFKKVLLHEMVHQYVYDFLFGFKYTLFQHGLRFHYVKWCLKKKYGIKI